MNISCLFGHKWNDNVCSICGQKRNNPINAETEAEKDPSQFNSAENQSLITQTKISKRIFISYGHDEHSNLAERLNQDLKKNGYQTWFDKDRLKPGNDWAGCIEEGFDWLDKDKYNSLMILLLTPYSVRRPDGFCLREIHRAQKSFINIIPLMVVESEQPIEICHLLWLNMQDCIPINEKEDFYISKFKLLLEAIEDNKTDFIGSQNRLKSLLDPLDFHADIVFHTDKFIGRKWIFEAINNWLKERNSDSRVFWIIGKAGIGKTALCAKICSTYQEIAAIHLCKFGVTQKSDPHCVVKSIAYQLSTQLSEYKIKLSAMNLEKILKEDARSIFDSLIIQPLSSISNPNKIVVILIDALDEIKTNGKNELANFIAAEFQKTPGWLRLIITSRKEESVTAPLQSYNPFIFDTDKMENHNDLRDYLQKKLAQMLLGRNDENLIIETILKNSEGLFLYIEHICNELINTKYLSLDHPDKFPKGLGGVFWQFLERQFPYTEIYEETIEPLIGVILAAREPITLELIQDIFNWEEIKLKKWIRVLGSLFTVSEDGEHKTIKPYHKSLADWLTDDTNDATKAGIYFVSLKAGHANLADTGFKAVKSKSESIPLYWVRHLLYHLEQSGRSSDALEIAADRKFIEMRMSLGLKKIFLSFSSDAFSVLERLYTDLTQLGHTVWRHTGDGEHGDQSSVNGADLIIALLSRRSIVMRSQCYRETMEAMLQGKVIIPIKVTATDLIVPFHLKRDQYIDLSSDYERGLNQISQLLGNSGSSILNTPTKTSTLDQAMSFLNQGQQNEAISLYQQELLKIEKEKGTEHPDFVEKLTELAQFYFSINLFYEAEHHFRRALTIYEKNYGNDHPFVATTLNNLASVLQNTNRFSEAEPLLRRSLEIYEKSYGKDHPDVANSLNNLASILNATNRLSEAEPLFRRALEIREKSYGKDDPDVALALNNLAMLLKNSNRISEAEPLFRRSLEIYEKSYGTDHPTMAESLNNLALLLSATNRFSEAETLFRRALEIREKSYGQKHPLVAISLNNLAALLSKTNRLSEAELLYRLALEIRENSYGKDHPDVADTLNNLASILNATNRLNEAEPLLRRALYILEKSYGKNHPCIANSLNNLIGLLYATNRLSEAEPLLRKALEVDEKTYGKGHPDVADSFNNLAFLLENTNRLNEAEPLLRKALEIEEKSYGKDHPDVVTSINNLATLLKDTNRFSEAEPLYRRSLEIYEKSYGKDHPYVATVLENLAGLLKDTNRIPEAETLFRRAREIKESIK